MVYEVGYEIPERKSLVKKLTEWVTPRAIGKFGIGFTLGNKEFFFGLTISSVVMETIIKRRTRKVYKKSGDLRVVDL